MPKISLNCCYAFGFLKSKIMAELKQQVDCSYCGSHNTVTVITKQSKYSRSIQVVKCTFCKVQNGIKEIFNRYNQADA